MPTAPIAVVIVDDQPLQRSGFRMVIDAQPDMTVVGEAGDGAQALAFARRNAVDVVLMDIRMPRVNGLVATGRIRTDDRVAEQGTPRVVLVTALDLEDHLAPAAEAGAFAVLYKDTAPEELLDAIRSAAKARAAD